MTWLCSRAGFTYKATYIYSSDTILSFLSIQYSSLDYLVILNWSWLYSLALAGGEQESAIAGNTFSSKTKAPQRSNLWKYVQCTFVVDSFFSPLQSKATFISEFTFLFSRHFHVNRHLLKHYVVTCFLKYRSKSNYFCCITFLAHIIHAVSWFFVVLFIEANRMNK